MTILRIAAFIFAAMFTGSMAQAEIKTQWVEYTHGDAKLKGYLAYDDALTGKRPAILMIHDRAGMQPYTLKHAEITPRPAMWCSSPTSSATARASCRRTCPRPSGPDGHLHQGPRADEDARPGRLRHAGEKSDGRCRQGRAGRLLLRRHGRRRFRLDRRAARGHRCDPRLVRRPSGRMGARTSRASS